MVILFFVFSQIGPVGFVKGINSFRKKWWGGGVGGRKPCRDAMFSTKLIVSNVLTPKLDTALRV